MSDEQQAVSALRGGIADADDPIVGHKTFCNEAGERWHEPLRQSEADELLAGFDAERARREREMPDEQSAINALWDAQYRLRDFGWKDPIYAPKDGSPLDIIELGSTGIHRGAYEGEWPTGGWWVFDGDSWPSRPALARPAQGMETRRAETEGLGAKHDSAVSEADAPVSSRQNISDVLFEALEDAERGITKYAEFYCEEDFDPLIDRVRDALRQAKGGASDAS